MLLIQHVKGIQFETPCPAYCSSNKGIIMNKRSREYRRRQLVYNGKYLEEYLKTNPRYINNKESIILPFLEHLEKDKLSADKIQIKQILAYLETLTRKKEETLRIALVEFFKTVVKTAKIEFDTEKLDDVLRKLQQESLDEERKAKTLTTEDVVKIRNELAAKNHYKILFAFEMFYIHGLTLGDVEQFDANNYSQFENIFRFKSKGKKKEIKLGLVITNLINKHPDLLDAKGRTTYSTYMQDISSTVKFQDRDKIIWKDIDETRKQYFPTCPNCKQKYPNSAEYWALIEIAEDVRRTHWIYCKDCATEIQGKA